MTTWKEIKDQPIVILGLTILASVSTTAGLYEKFIVPARDPNASQRVAILQSQLDTSQKLLAEIPSLQKRLEKAEADLADQAEKMTARIAEAEARATKASADADQRVRAAQWANTFEKGSPYPIGLDQVRVGDPITKLETVYPGKVTDTERDGWRQIRQTGNAVFDRITFYFASDTKEQKITHIVFWSQAIDSHEVAEDWLKSRVASALGEPKAWREMHYSWEGKGPQNVYVRPGSLMIMRPNSRPGIWPKS